jgi:uncharacterized membrane protein
MRGLMNVESTRTTVAMIQLDEHFKFTAKCVYSLVDHFTSFVIQRVKCIVVTRLLTLYLTAVCVAWSLLGSPRNSQARVVPF